ncbi:hypothetical protein [Pontibacter ruber]|uniref:Lipoprotein n=1 Tax=Pontibacter ruber TaxID=1343895 RepID=A0ABW5CX86_9BACT|nr:hypothetical protein [Pontibacter ruber]
MPRLRFLYLTLFCLVLLLGSGCQRKGIPCPKPSKARVKVQGKNASGLQGVDVPMDKNGLVKKKRRR